LSYASGGPRDVDLLYTAAILRKDFDGAEILQLEEKEVQLTEGRLHSGPAAVVLAVFRQK
jgi:hypothetical protein